MRDYKYLIFKYFSVSTMVAGAALVGPAALGLDAPWLGDAEAHIQLLSPTQRIPDQKAGPCGRSDSTRGSNVTTFPPGATITLQWEETVNHPGHFRISFDADGDDDFVDPRAFDDFNTAPSVLLDDIPDTPSGGISGATITLPDIECDNCTLQVIQVMTDKPPYGDGNDIYYQCADIALQSGAPEPPDAGPITPSPVDGGCSAGGGSGGPLALALALLWLSLRQRRSARRRRVPGLAPTAR